MSDFGNNLDNFYSVSGGKPYAGMSMWGQQPANAGFDPNTLSDPWQRAQYDMGREQLDLRRQEIDLMGQANQPLSGWQQGAQTFGTVSQGLANLANIWMGYQGLKQQKEAFKFNKGVVNTNLGNAISDYNRRLNDTLQNRALNNGQGQGWVSEQLSKYQAKRSG